MGYRLRSMVLTAVTVMLFFCFAMLWQMRPLDRSGRTMGLILVLVVIVTGWLWSEHFRHPPAQATGSPPPKPPPIEHSPALVPRDPRGSPSLAAHASPHVAKDSD